MFQRVAAVFLILFPFVAGGAEPIRGFVSVEPFELRLEAIVEVAPFREAWRLQGEEIDLSGRQAVLDNIATLFESGVNLSSPGKAINFTGRSVRFIVPDPEVGYVSDERENIPITEALVGITLSADVREVRELSGEWLWFAPGQSALVLEIASRGKPSARLLSPQNRKFAWELEEEIAMPAMLDVPGVERFQSRPARHLIFLGLLMLVAAAVVVIRLKQKSPSWVGWLTVGGIACAVASFQIRIDRVETPADPEIEELVYASLRNIYHAFDFREESSIYDTLAETVTGPLLEEVYLEIRQSLELESLGGPRVKVYEIALREWEIANSSSPEELVDESLRVLANWATIGEVTHWGHTHERTNRYEAEITFTVIKQRWKVSVLELLNEERVQKVSRREAITLEETSLPAAP